MFQLIVKFFFGSAFILDVLLGLSDVILLRYPGEDGGSTQCSGVAGHSVHLVNCSGKNQRGETASKLKCPLLCLSLCALV